jgi:hypothetical protein
MQAYYYGRTATIRDRTDVCTYSNLGFLGNDGSFYHSTEGNSLCPLRSNVPYLLLTSFTVQQLSRDSSLEFTPDLIMWFYATPEDYDAIGSSTSTSTQSSSRIGCVQTGTLAQVALNQRRSTRGAVALIASIFCLFITVGLCYHGFSGRRRRRDSATAGLSEPNRLSLLVRQYHYRRTNHSGSVSLAPSLRKGNSVGSRSHSGGRSSSTRTSVAMGSIVVPPPPPLPIRTTPMASASSSFSVAASVDTNHDSIAKSRSDDGKHSNSCTPSRGSSSIGLLAMQEQPVQESLSDVI